VGSRGGRISQDRDTRQEWQLTDLAATMRPYAKLIRQLDAEMVEALEDSQ
jgi:hypothetical protein